MLFDISGFRAPLPEGVMVFASGFNQLSEIRGFARLGIPVGVSVNHLGQAAIAELVANLQPVMIDSGAFSEVAFGPEGARIVAPITHAEWKRRLAIYIRLAVSLGERAMLVAPDQVGDQDATLQRLTNYRAELATIAQTGATLLLPLQIGLRSHGEFYEAAQCAAGVPLTPAMPMRKAVTSAAALLEFVHHVRPCHIHLLGIGVDNRRAAKLIQAIQHYSPGTAISMDSNRLRAKAGSGRPLTECEGKLRSAETEDVYGAVDSPVLTLSGEALDYTDLIASPSHWADDQRLRRLAVAVGLPPHQERALVEDPDTFLQSPFRDPEGAVWIEHPLMSMELDREWQRCVDETAGSAVRTAAIVTVFADSRIRWQADLVR